MGVTVYNGEEIVRRGQQLYEDSIRPQVESGNRDKILVINVQTGEHVIDADEMAATETANARFGDVRLFVMRIGSPAMYRLGGRFADSLP